MNRTMNRSTNRLVNRFNAAITLLGVLLATIALVSSADGQTFGRVGAVNQEATGTPPGGATQRLTVGANVVVRERVRTSASGSTQIQFPDQSAINLGANCDLVIDQFVYNPGARSGTLVATASRGVLRFIGGNISHNAGATIRTPSASLGIRGGMVTVMMPLPPRVAQSDPALAGLHGELVLAHFGQITLSNNVSTVSLRSGFATVIGSRNEAIPEPFRVSEQTLRLIMRLIHSKPSQTGGVAHAIKPGQVPAGYRYTRVQDPSEPPGTDPLGYVSIFGTNGKGVSQTNQSGSVSLPPPPPPSGGGD
jgi:hypothetical protein